MPQEPHILATTVLLLDASKNQRTYWADQLKRCSADYEILEGSDGESGLALCRSRRIDCVVLELSLPEELGFEVLMKLVPTPSRPQVAVVVLTHMTHKSLLDLAQEHGAYTCLVKQFTTGEDLHRAIQRAVSLVGRMPKEDRHRHRCTSYSSTALAPLGAASYGLTASDADRVGDLLAAPTSPVVPRPRVSSCVLHFSRIMD